MNESLKGFLHAGRALEQDKRPGDRKRRTAPILDLVLWFFPIPRIELSEGKKKETSFGFFHLTRIVTLQHFRVLLLFFLNVLL